MQALAGFINKKAVIHDIRQPFDPDRMKASKIRYTVTILACSNPWRMPCRHRKP